MVELMELIKIVTQYLCGAKYLTLNLVYSYMKLLKRKFAPKDNETVKTYINLIYSETYEKNDEEIDDDIPAANSHQHWQYAHRQFYQKMRSTHAQAEQGQKQNKNQAESNNT